MKHSMKILAATLVLAASQPTLADNGWGNPGSWGNAGSWGPDSMMNNRKMMGNPMGGMNPQQMMGSNIGGRLDRMEAILMSVDASLKQLVQLEMRKGRAAQ